MSWICKSLRSSMKLYFLHKRHNLSYSTTDTIYHTPQVQDAARLLLAVMSRVQAHTDRQTDRQTETNRQTDRSIVTVSDSMQFFTYSQVVILSPSPSSPLFHPHRSSSLKSS